MAKKPEGPVMTLEEQRALMFGPDIMLRALANHGITPDKLAADMKRGLSASVTKTLKVKGELDKTKLPKGFKVVSSTGQETVIQLG